MTVHTVLLEHGSALVRVMELSALATAPAHYHSTVHEYIVCLEGEITVYANNGEAPKVLQEGNHACIPARVVHWLRNESRFASKYLLSQSGGVYDFIEVTD